MSTSVKALRRLKLFRVNESGIRIPWILEIDDDRTVIKEAPEEGAQLIVPTQVTARSPVQREESDPERQKMGVMARWCTSGIKVNPIPGTDTLRARFFEDLAALEASYTTETPCPPCLRGKLMRRYRTLVEEAGLL
jgi:hypothetical protein